VLLSLYLAVLDDQSKEEQFIDVYNIYKRLVYHRSKKTEVYVYVEKAFVVHCYFSGDSLEFCLHRNGR